MSRAKRKIEHIHHALNHDRDFHNHFDDMEIVHQSLAELDWEEITLSAKVGGLYLSSPLFVNAMTGGGGEKTKQINGELAQVARKANISMAVGSQMSALKDPAERSSYEIVRKENPDGIIFANVGSEASKEQACAAVDMIAANALQIHVNTLQELIMPEGDRNFSKRMENIQTIAEEISVPVIVKEVGYGMSKETVKALYAHGIRYIDIGGKGGTNFSKVENIRRDQPFASFENWGIPTPISLAEARSAASDMNIFASGASVTG
ncbi:type 2 isopentenyl-diphosphate Delta-isomerase [Halobacillus salinarum]|uniref:Type 2 isopentenyl-diphosphate Delta-isomerase n=1 Tax=Halobacillus salinarum TaxID=2932257 RepID=A0ABY4EFD4_9BACI|nr:type 2 isopentenyl-diphosphate Delta-isomerase [Halobacillus salinarum]UOQ42695.1 type 2 isopentenyl-diphosphate Delta-isomerase [Halobacillus salinarum]